MGKLKWIVLAESMSEPQLREGIRIERMLVPSRSAVDRRP